jgi:hypothetical protein
MKKHRKGSRNLHNAWRKIFRKGKRNRHKLSNRKNFWMMESHKMDVHSGLKLTKAGIMAEIAQEALENSSKIKWTS